MIRRRSTDLPSCAGCSEHKPFECVGEIEESAAVMAHLADDAGLARRRGGAGAVAAAARPAIFARCSRRADPHLVPERYLAMLDACG